MVYLFHGDDSFSSYQAAKAQAKKLAAGSGSQPRQLKIIEADETPTQEFMQHLGGMTLFGQQNVILAKRLLDNPRLVEYFLDNLAELNSKPIVIWHPAKADGRSALVKKLKQQSEVQEFATLSEGEAKNWLRQYSTKQNIKLDQSSMDLLVNTTAANKGMMSSEIDKLKLYGEERVNVSLLRSTSGLEQSGDIWTFLDALAGGNQAKALQEFNRLIKFSQNEQYLLAMLNRELWLIAQVKLAQMSGRPLHQLGLAPFVLRKTTAKAQNFSWEKVQKLAFGLMRLDLAIKQGKVDPIDGLMMYLLSW